VQGRDVIVADDDFTLRGSSADASIWEKFKTAERLALEYRLPLFRLVEGSGGGGPVRSLEKSGYANLPGGVGGQSGGLDVCCANLAAVRVIAMALGSVAGLGAARVGTSHYSIMVKDISAMFVAGPPIVERLGETRSKQELGGWAVQLAAACRTCGAAEPGSSRAGRRTDAWRGYSPPSLRRPLRSRRPPRPPAR
jgi:acetyl-CoA carboxylase carboxyltransferase component